MRRILETGDPSELGSTKLPQGAARSKVAGGAGHHVSMMTLVSASNCVFTQSLFLLLLSDFNNTDVWGLDCVCWYVCAFVYEREI